MIASRGAIALALLLLSASAVAQESTAEAAEPLIDLTGAGVLDLGDLEVPLRPHRRALERADGRLPLRLRIAANGAMIGCESLAEASLAEATEAVCQQAMRQGSFKSHAFLALDYTEATYHVTVSAREKGRGPYWLATDYSDVGVAVRFGDYRIPPVQERLSGTDVRSTPMNYPSRALRRGLEARVVVALTFQEDGRVAQCRPVSSSNSSRMAYDTCRAAHRSYRLLNPPDPRPYVMATNWILSD